MLLNARGASIGNVSGQVSVVECIYIFNKLDGVRLPEFFLSGANPGIG